MFAPPVKAPKAKTASQAPPAHKSTPLQQRHVQQAADSERIASPEGARGGSWDFSKIPLFAPNRPTGPEVPRPFIQPKLMIGRVNDPLEHEADRVADQVMRMPDKQQQRACACGSPAMGAGECSACRRRHRLSLQTKLKVNKPGSIYEQEGGRVFHQVTAMSGYHAVSGTPPRIQRFLGQSNEQIDTTLASAALPVVHKVLHSPGQALDPATRAFMEPRFGYDFSTVRVHTDADAAKAATSVRARAFTSGRNIFFRQGEYKPSSQIGRALLAHELTHVIQQKDTRQSEQIQRSPGDSPNEPLIAGTSNDAMEMWKDVIAHRHFQQKGLEGNITFARMKIIDKEGRTIVNVLTESDVSLHAEEKAIGLARQQLGSGQTVEGGKIIFVTDSMVCDKPGRCRTQINKLAQELGVEEANATIIRRSVLPQEGKGPLSTPKATAKKVQQRVVEGLELTTSTETIYKRRRNLPGGTLARVKPPAQMATGGITPKSPMDVHKGSPMPKPKSPMDVHKGSPMPKPKSPMDVHRGGMPAVKSQLEPPTRGRLAAVGMAMEGAAMFEFAVFNLVLPLLFDWMEEGLEADRQVAIKNAMQAAVPEIQRALNRHGVARDEFAAILQQTKGGRVIYANVSCKIELEATPELRFYLVKLKLSTTSISRYDGDDNYIVSFPVYTPDALATELLGNVPDAV
jgi:hypothetical protein